jgi:drug/metabolite transporter (DMT)-like permease
MSGPRHGAREGPAVVATLAATAIWGATFVVIRDSLHALDPATLVFLRFALATLLLGVIALWRRPRFDRDAWTGGVAGGLCAAGGFVFQAIGLTATRAGTSAFLTCTGTLFAALFAWPLLGQRPSLVLAAGIALAFAGSALLPEHGVLRLGAGELWTLLGALCFALQIVALARFAPRADPLALTLVEALVLTLVLAPCARQPLATLRALDAPTTARLAYLVVAGAALAPFLQVFAQRVLPPGRIGLLFALEPVFAIGFAVTAGGERFGGPWWLGAVLILAGVAGVEWRALRSGLGTAGGTPASMSATP